MVSKKHLVVNYSWGVGSLRNCTGFPYRQDEYHIPIGCCIAKWNIRKKEREIFQVHYDIITIMLMNNKDIILTVSFSGELKLWNKSYQLLLTFQLPTDNITFGCWSLDINSIAITSDGPTAMLLVYNIEILLHPGKEKSYKWKCIAPQKPHIGDNSTRDKKYDHFIACAFKENSEVIAVLKLHASVQIYLFGDDGSIIKTAGVTPLGEEVDILLCISKVHENTIVLGLNRGIFAFYDVNSLVLQTIIQAGGSQVCLWHNDLLLTMSYESGILMMWSKDGCLVHEIKDGPTGSIINMSPSFRKNSFMVGGIMSLHQIILSDDNSKITEGIDLSFHKLTGCGISVSHDNIVASGDMTGSLFLWKNKINLPIHQLSMNGSIRSLVWFKNYLLIGLLSGELYQWDKCESNQSNTEITSKLIFNHDVKMIYHFMGSVVCMQINNAKTKVAVGTTTGHLFVFELKIESGKLHLNTIYNVEAHKPKLIDGDKRIMEIWSLSWNCNDEMIATSSEDQSTIISCAKTGKHLHVLTGHTSAVTSVGWKVLSKGDNILTTCADDRTVRIYNGCTFDLRHVINPITLSSWYTLTYLCINTKNDTLVCCTENGHLIVWDITTYECLIKSKVHTGSIEGLVLDEEQNFIFTTSSDCVVNKFSVSA